MTQALRKKHSKKMEQKSLAESSRQQHFFISANGFVEIKEYTPSKSNIADAALCIQANPHLQQHLSQLILYQFGQTNSLPSALQPYMTYRRRIRPVPTECKPYNCSTTRFQRHLMENVDENLVKLAEEEFCRLQHGDVECKMKHTERQAAPNVYRPSSQLFKMKFEYILN